MFKLYINETNEATNRIVSERNTLLKSKIVEIDDKLNSSRSSRMKIKTQKMKLVEITWRKVSQ